MKTKALSLIFLSPLLMGISFEEYYQKALTHSPKMIEATGALNSFTHIKEYENAFDSPTLNISSRKIRTDDSRDEFERAFFVSMPFVTPWANEAQDSFLDAKEEYLKLSLDEAKEMLKIELKREYLLNKISKERAKISTEAAREAEEELIQSKKKFDAGRVSKVELSSFESSYKSMLLESKKASSQARESMQRLASYIGEDSVEIEAEGFSYLATTSDEIKRMIEDSIPVKKLRSISNALKKEADMVRAYRLDAVTFGIGYTKEETQKSLDFAVSIPLGITNKSEHKIASLLEELSAQNKKIEIIKQKSAKEADILSNRLKALKDGIEEAKESVKTKESLVQMVQKGYQGGVLSKTEYLLAKEGLRASREELLGLKKEYVESLSELQTLVCKELK